LALNLLQNGGLSLRYLLKKLNLYLYSFKGKEKGRVLAQALEKPDDVVSLPLRLVLEATFVLDTEAYKQLDLNTLTTE
jgi:hypothetical protein